MRRHRPLARHAAQPLRHWFVPQLRHLRPRDWARQPARAAPAVRFRAGPQAHGLAFRPASRPARHPCRHPDHHHYRRPNRGLALGRGQDHCHREGRRDALSRSHLAPSARAAARRQARHHRPARRQDRRPGGDPGRVAVASPLPFQAPGLQHLHRWEGWSGQRQFRAWQKEVSQDPVPNLRNSLRLIYFRNKNTSNRPCATSTDCSCQRTRPLRNRENT